MNRDEIARVLPHRDDMLLLDEVSLAGGVSTGRYTVRGDEFFLRGHFPGNPVVPGAILCEMMGQSACLLTGMDAKTTTPYFAGMNGVKFKNKVVPGDTVTFRCELLKTKGPFYFIKGAGYVGDTLCVSGELSFAMIKNEG